MGCILQLPSSYTIQEWHKNRLECVRLLQHKELCPTGLLQRLIASGLCWCYTKLIPILCSKSRDMLPKVQCCSHCRPLACSHMLHQFANHLLLDMLWDCMLLDCL